MAPPKTLRVAPDELRGSAGVFDRAGQDVSGVQARSLDTLFANAAAAAGDHGLSGALLSCASDDGDIAKTLGGMISEQAGRLRDAANKYEHGDAAGAAAINSRPIGSIPPTPLLNLGGPQ